MSEDNITTNDTSPEFSGQAAIRKFYFLLESEQRKIFCLLGTLKRLQFTSQTLTEHSADVFQITESQFDGLTLPLELNSESVSTEVGTTLRSICESLNVISGRMSIDEFGEKFLLERIDIVCNKLGFYESCLQQVLLRMQPLIEKQHLDIEMDALLLAEISSELRILADFPFLYIEGFDSDSYMSAYPDLVLALATGVFAAPVIHFVKHGYSEIAEGTRKLSGDNPVHGLVFGSVASAPTEEQSTNTEVATDESVSTGNCEDANELKASDLEISLQIDGLSDAARSFVELVKKSGVIDESWYAKRHAECSDQVEHFLFVGLVQGEAPNFLFESDWYYQRYLSGQNTSAYDSVADEFAPEDSVRTKEWERSFLAIEHYVKCGAKVDLLPGPGFEAEWYRRNYFDSTNHEYPLAHYLTTGVSSDYSPNSVFDIDYYLKENPDVAAENYEPAKHFYQLGWKESRHPAPWFDMRFYRNNHLQGSTDINPLNHYLLHGRDSLLPTDGHTSREAQEGYVQKASLPGTLRHFSNPGPRFEYPMSTAAAAEAAVKCIAFFLPQFHEFEENNEWWGKGFTEWRNVSRGAPRFKEHYQPRIPRDLGHYNLLHDNVMEEQATLAMANGISAFCFYYYWFNGKRLMDKPLDRFADSSAIEMPFCIMWANENWTRTWDGHDNEVLIRQDYKKTDEKEFIADTARYFRNEKYITVAGRPLFIIYRPGLIPEAKNTIRRWRDMWQAEFNLEPLIFMVQGFGETDPRVYDLDGALEFPPHKIVDKMPDKKPNIAVFDDKYTGNVFAYDEVVDRSLSEAVPEFPLVKTVSPHWDNDARREGRGLTLQGSTPELYQYWLNGACRFAEAYPVENESIVFINAWNEWAESAYLEPDVYFGHAYLNATKKVLQGLPDVKHGSKVLLVGHDAHAHGAQMILLHIGKTLKSQFNIDVIFALKKGGALLPDHERVGPTHVLEGMREPEIESFLNNIDAEYAITNTIVTGDIVPILKKADMRVVSLVHELPRIAKENGLVPQARHIAKLSDTVIGASEFVVSGFESYAGDVVNERVVRAQGSYKAIKPNKAAGEKVRQQLGIPVEHKVVLNTGFADMRKGVDLFITIANEVVQEAGNIHFIWVGEVCATLKHWLFEGISTKLSERLHFVGFSDDIEDYCNASDCFLLTSREDPYPSVVLEAMSAGCPPIVFKGCTGLEALAEKYGRVVELGNMRQISDSIQELLWNDTPELQSARRDEIENGYQYNSYCFELLECLFPDLKRVSVVVPNYNYEHYMEARLLSVFRQTYPVYEVIVLDDCSSDGSVEKIETILSESGRDASFVVNAEPSGNVFRQWKKGLDNAGGDYIWIAEADDGADPRFLEEMMATIDSTTALAFCNSRQTDSAGQIVADDYNYYYNDIELLENNSSFACSGNEFVERCLSVKNPILNVSSVVWNTGALRQALGKISSQVLTYRLVGDWRLYIEVLSVENVSVSYNSKSLNIHRRHESSVTHSLDPEEHINEIADIHQTVLNAGFGNDQLEQQMARYIAELKLQFGLESQPDSDESGVQQAAA